LYFAWILKNKHKEDFVNGTAGGLRKIKIYIKTQLNTPVTDQFRSINRNKIVVFFPRVQKQTVTEIICNFNTNNCHQSKSYNYIDSIPRTSRVSIEPSLGEFNTGNDKRRFDKG
jgi:hypothetical protein